MRNIFFAVALLAPLFLGQSAYAKEIAVLLPVTGPLTPLEKIELSKDALSGLSDRFDLKHGTAVDRFVQQVFQEESKKKDCDEANCYRRIAAHYHAKKIAAFRVAQLEQGRYLVIFNLYDVVTGDMAASEKQECTECSLEKLKTMFKELTQSKTDRTSMRK